MMEEAGRGREQVSKTILSIVISNPRPEPEASRLQRRQQQDLVSFQRELLPTTVPDARRSLEVLKLIFYNHPVFIVKIL